MDGKAQEISVATRQRCELVDITRMVEEATAQLGAWNGICFLFVPHTTAAILINENADPSVARDVLGHLESLVPSHGRYSHLEGNAAAHIKAAMLGPSVSVPVKDGKLQLGTWQGVFLAEFDGPRKRRVVLTPVRCSET